MKRHLIRLGVTGFLIAMVAAPFVPVTFADETETAPTVTETEGLDHGNGTQTTERPGWGCGDMNHEHSGRDGAGSDSPCRDDITAPEDSQGNVDDDVRQDAGHRPELGEQGNSAGVRQDADNRSEPAEQGNSAGVRQDADHRPETVDQGNSAGVRQDADNRPETVDQGRGSGR